jgi:hypothetical protein
MVTLSQKAYLQKILKRFNMTDSNPVCTPADSNIPLTLPEGSIEVWQDVDALPYMELVGSLMYLMVGTRPDIAQAVGALCQHMKNPKDRHWNAGKRVLRYLKGTMNFKLTYKGVPEGGKLVAYTDADYAGDRATRKSTSGVLFTLANGAVSWQSKQQSTIALSTTEAEYIAACFGTREVMYLRQLLKELGYEQEGPTSLCTDSQGALAVMKNPLTSPRTKHFDVSYHYTRQQIRAGVIEVSHLQTSSQPADVLTKPLPREAFVRHRAAMGVLA